MKNVTILSRHNWHSKNNMVNRKNLTLLKIINLYKLEPCKQKNLLILSIEWTVIL